MQKLPLIVTFLIFLGSTTYAQYGSIKGNGNVTKTTRQVGSFSEIEAGGSVNVFLTQGNKYGIVIEADENLHKVIKTEVQGNKLVIKNKENVKDAEKFDVYVTFKNITAISGSGSTDIEALTSLETNSNFSVACSGATDMLLKKGLRCEKLNIAGSGSSDIEIDNVRSDNTKLQVSGSVDVELNGETNDVTLNATGSSDISAREFVANNVNVSTTGSSDVYIHASKSINVNASGSSDVYCWGNPSNKHVKTTSSADVTMKN